MKLLTATLVKNPRSVNTKFGPKIVADCKLDNGEDVTLWQPENSQIINYGNGSKLTLTVDSKGKYHWVETENETAITSKPESNQTEQIKTDYSLSKTDKQAIASYIQQQRDLLAFCWEQAKSIPGHESEDTTEKLAATLYLSAQRKFNLA
ncbi:MAG: hypothetical protein ACKO2V_07485 [Snowella sp.]